MRSEAVQVLLRGHHVLVTILQAVESHYKCTGVTACMRSIQFERQRRTAVAVVGAAVSLIMVEMSLQTCRVSLS